DRRDTHFLSVWGQPNIQKENRLSWSGKPIPKIDQWNTFGCILLVNENNDIEIVYDYLKDLRLDKDIIVPDIYRKGPIVIAKWDAVK
ncbi:LlaMI family restriction endonuclease, partial [Pseudomonas syringae]|uniref:LlaMI family restriction endonuclease n=1 Tax=Pseudomonas syringae TaxID=317 RepID=UPI0034D69B1B